MTYTKKEKGGAMSRRRPGVSRVSAKLEGNLVFLRRTILDAVVLDRRDRLHALGERHDRTDVRVHVARRSRGEVFLGTFEHVNLLGFQLWRHALWLCAFLR